VAQLVTGIGQAKVLNALDTYNHTALTANMYTVSVDMSELPPSGLSVVIKQNGSTMATAALPADSQSNIKLQVVLNCAINDTIGVVLSSAQASDTGLNVVKGLLNIHVGST